jgi:hypothetical protein
VPSTRKSPAVRPRAHLEGLRILTFEDRILKSEDSVLKVTDWRKVQILKSEEHHSVNTSQTVTSRGRGERERDEWAT